MRYAQKLEQTQIVLVVAMLVLEEKNVVVVYVPLLELTQIVRVVAMLVLEEKNVVVVYVPLLERIQIVLVAVLLVQVENVAMERVKRHKLTMIIVAIAVTNVTHQVKNVLLVHVLAAILLVLDLMYVVI